MEYTNLEYPKAPVTAISPQNEVKNKLLLFARIAEVIMIQRVFLEEFEGPAKFFFKLDAS
jgi:hypothetical protein